MAYFICVYASLIGTLIFGLSDLELVGFQKIFFFIFWIFFKNLKNQFFFIFEKIIIPTNSR